jgi:hypothetical protein
MEWNSFVRVADSRDFESRGCFCRERTISITNYGLMSNLAQS